MIVVLVILGLAYAQTPAAQAPPKTIVTNIDAPKASEPVGKYENGIQLRERRPAVPDGVVVMDKGESLLEEQSPRFELDPSAPHGIQKRDIALVKRITGRIYDLSGRASLGT